LHSSKYGSQNTFVKFQLGVFQTTSCYANLLSLCSHFMGHSDTATLL